jgi:hypothetical protein
MKSPSGFLSGSIYASLCGLILVLFSIVFAKSEYAADPVGPFVVDMAKELGVALIVAAVIVEAIERVSRSEQREEIESLIVRIKTDVLEAVYGTEIAKVFFNRFHEVIRLPLLRRDCTFTAVLAAPGSEPGKPLTSDDTVTVDVTLSFDLKNCSEENHVQKIPAFLERPWPELVDRKIPGVGIRSIRVRRKDGKTEDVTTNIQPASPGSRNDLAEVAYELPLAPQETATVIYAYRLAKFARDTSSFFTVIPTESMRFVIEHDLRLSLFYTNVHKEDFFDETPALSPGRLHLRSNGPLFPANGIEFWWAPART